MSLTTLADFESPAISDTSKTVADLVPFRVLATDPSKLMPPASANSPLTMDEKILLTHWSTGGGLGAVETCPITHTQQRY